MKKYRVHIGYNGRGAKYVYFNTMVAACQFCSEVADKTNVILSIEEVLT